jgi:hypothetical protein
VNVVPVPRPNTAQIVSATVQNVVISLVIGAGWLYFGKIDSSLAVPSLLGIAGIDLLNRRTAQVHPAAAIAFGATSLLHLFAKHVPHA